ncbi:hypothetical protein T484DRAFT_1969784, partial [Baffinella frigidus]
GRGEAQPSLPPLRRHGEHGVANGVQRLPGADPDEPGFARPSRNRVRVPQPAAGGGEDQREGPHEPLLPHRP